MDPIDIAARALANMDDSLYEVDEETTAMYNTDDNNAKRVKRDSMPKVPKPKPVQPPPSSLIVSFKNQEGINYFNRHYRRLSVFYCAKQRFHTREADISYSDHYSLISALLDGIPFPDYAVKNLSQSMSLFEVSIRKTT